MPSKKTRAKNWWGTFEIPEGSSGRWDIGPLSLWVQHNREDWTVTRSRDADPFLDRSNVTIPATGPDDSQTDVQRFAAERLATTVYVRPAQADRPVVITPDRPFTLPPKRTVHLYVSLPLWYQVLDQENGKPLLDEPIIRPSDTWHGPNTRIGHLCYASRTRASFDIMKTLPHRVVSPFEVRNQSESDLLIERIKLPTPHLSILADPQGQLWTEPIVFDKSAGTDPPDVRIETDRKHGQDGFETLTGPRMKSEKKFVWHAFGELFGTGW